MNRLDPRGDCVECETPLDGGRCLQCDPRVPNLALCATCDHNRWIQDLDREPASIRCVNGCPPPLPELVEAGPNLTIRFRGQAGHPFSASRQAEQWIRGMGWSIGPSDITRSRAVMYGPDWVIAKWKNLTAQEIAATDAIVTGSGRHGPLLFRRLRAPESVDPVDQALALAEQTGIPPGIALSALGSSHWSHAGGPR